MTEIQKKREGIQQFYAQNERVLLPLIKFILAWLLFFYINSTAGVLQQLDFFWINLILALLCAFMPFGVTAVVCGLMITWGFSKISLELAGISVLVFLLMYLLIFHFIPKSSIVVLLVPLAFLLKVPEMIPVCVGLLGNIALILPMSCGVLVYYLLIFAKLNGAAIVNLEDETNINRLIYIFNRIFTNQEMYLWLVMLAGVTLLIYLIRRASTDHSWTIGMIVGVIVELLIVLIGEYLLDTETDLLFLFLGSVLAIAVGFLLELFCFNVDFSRVEYVQFEDDEYYYYVKAVPKIYLPAKDVVKKKITAENDDMKKHKPGKDTEEIERMLDEFYGKQ